MRGFTIPVLLLAACTGAQGAGDQACDRYSKHEVFPEGLDVIAEGDYGAKWRLMVISDGECTCNNSPAIHRDLGKNVPEGINWQCRNADVEERAAFANEPRGGNR